MKKSKADLNELYRLHEHGYCFSMLEGKRIAVISGYADNVRNQLNSQVFRKRHQAESEFDVVTSIQVPGKLQVPKHAFWPDIRERMERHSWDLALVAAGTFSIVICDHARQMGRAAIDIGAIDRVLIGCEHNQTIGFDVPKNDVPKYGRGTDSE